MPDTPSLSRCSLRMSSSFSLDPIVSLFSADIATPDGTNLADSSSTKEYIKSNTSTTNLSAHTLGKTSSSVGEAANRNTAFGIIQDDIGKDMVRIMHGTAVGFHQLNELQITISKNDEPSIEGRQILSDPVEPSDPHSYMQTQHALATNDSIEGPSFQSTHGFYCPAGNHPLTPLASPLEAPKSGESRFTESFPEIRRSWTPALWIKRKRSRGRTHDFSVDAGAKPNEISSEKSNAHGSSSRSLKRISLAVNKWTIRENSIGTNAVSQPHVGPAKPSQPAFPSLLDKALSPSKPSTRMETMKNTIVGASRRLSVTGGPQRRFTTLDTTRPQSSPSRLPDITSQPELPLPSSKRRNTFWEFEFLPSEARGVKTPKKYPVYKPKHIGGHVMSSVEEREYFELADMCQSKPPLKVAADLSSTVDPIDCEGSLDSSDMHLMNQHSPDIGVIAPFLDQDNRTDPTFFGSLLKAKDAVKETDSKIRRASLKIQQNVTRKILEVTELPKIRQRQSPMSSGNSSTVIQPEPQEIPHTLHLGHSELSISSWAIQTSEEAAVVPIDSSRLLPALPVSSKEKPAEVVIEEMRREKRDTGIMGLDPETPGSSSDDSYTYAAMLRDIAGLSKRPQRPVMLAQPAEQEIGVLVTPPPPHFPSTSIHPGTIVTRPSKISVDTSGLQGSNNSVRLVPDGSR
jgi:hypothetical protein